MVDADLRRASIDKYFGLSNQFGLTNALFDQGNLNLYVRSTSIEKLSVRSRELPAGDCVPCDANTVEQFDAERLNRLVK